MKAFGRTRVRFVWPAQRYDRITSGTTLVAAALTISAGWAISLPADSIYRAENEELGDGRARRDGEYGFDAHADAV